MAILKILFSWAFYILDRFRDKYFIPITGSLFINGLRLKGAKLGKVKLYGKPILKMHPNSEVSLEDNVRLNSSTFKCTSGSIYAPCKLVTICSTAKIFIGKDINIFHKFFFNTIFVILFCKCYIKLNFLLNNGFKR